MYPDGRGTITLNPNAVHLSGITLRFVLASNAGSGRLMEFDGNGTIKGALELQTSSAFGTSGIKGNYVFRMAGADGSGNPMAQIGLMAADGNGNVTSGSMDSNDFGTIAAAAALSPSTYLVGSNGRGTMTIGGSSYAVYVVSSNKFNLLQIDGAPASAL